jgi:hypothetical protein
MEKRKYFIYIKYFFHTKIFFGNIFRIKILSLYNINNMTNMELCNAINNSIVESCDKFISKSIRNKQNEHQKEKYPNATPGTKVKCIVCEGMYMIRNRSIHNNTKKHQKCVKDIKKQIFKNIFI